MKLTHFFGAVSDPLLAYTFSSNNSSLLKKGKALLSLFHLAKFRITLTYSATFGSSLAATSLVAARVTVATLLAPERRVLRAVLLAVSFA